MLNKITYKDSELLREALIIIAGDKTIDEDYEFKNAMVDLLADRLCSALSSEIWAVEYAERKAKEEAERAEQVRVEEAESRQEEL